MEWKSLLTPASVSLAKIASHVHVQTLWLGNWGLITGLNQLRFTHPEPGAGVGLP